MTDQEKYSHKLKGARILIIGGSSGIGLAVAEASIESGAAGVTISSSNPDHIKAAASLLRHSYPSSSCEIASQACDLGDENKLEPNIVDLFNSVTSNGSRKLDHIIFTATDPLAVKSVHEVDFEFIKRAGMLRFFAPLLMAKHATEYLLPGPTSSITLTTGSVSERPLPNWTVIGSYATGLHGMTRGLALDLRPVRVNLVSPGVVNTAFWDNKAEEDKAAFFKKVAESSATQRFAEVEDVAEAFLYCMKDHNLTGSIISTNGCALIM